MRVSILLQITADDGTACSTEEVVAFEKATERAEDVGLSLAQGKALLAAVHAATEPTTAAPGAVRHRLGQDVGLTPREVDVLTLITQGLSNQEIAETSYLSINSVKTYIRSAYRRIGVTSRSQAVVWCLQHGFAAGPEE